MANTEYSVTFPNGNTLITGRLVVRVTDNVSGESVVRNVSGPVLIRTGPAGEEVVVLSGSSISPVFAIDDPSNLVGVGLFVFHGPTVFTEAVLTQVSGSYENLCLTLA